MNDYIYKYGNKKYYKGYCSICGKDRGYVQKRHINNPCASCSAKNTIKTYGNPMQGRVHTDKEKFRNNTYDNIDYNDTQITFTKAGNKIIKYKQNCPKCNDEIGYRRHVDALRTCRKCQHDAKRKYTSEQRRLRNAVKANVGARLRARNSGKNYTSTFSMLDFTFEQLVEHLESKFKPGMTLENFGEWEIDHIKPDSLFNYESYNDIEFKKSWSLCNLQPLWKNENASKGNKWKEVEEE